MAKTLRGIDSGTLAPRPQRNEDATYAPLLKKEDGQIDWSAPPHEIYNRMRAFTPWPGAFTTFRGQTCHISGVPASKELNANASVNSEPFDPQTLPGTIRRSPQGAILVTCGGATELHLLSVKLAGGQATDASEFASASRLTEWGRFGDT